MITIEVLKGKEIEKYIKYLASLRILMFREFPYLYDGTVEVEQQYISPYNNTPEGRIILAKDQGSVVGMLTGIPALEIGKIMDDFKVALEKNNTNINNFYYYGEALILPAFRKQGLLKKMFNKLDEEIKKLGYKHVYGISVIRENNHPLKPANYKNTDGLWEHMGLKKVGITINCTYPTITETGKTLEKINVMQLWQKDL